MKCQTYIEIAKRILECRLALMDNHTAGWELPLKCFGTVGGFCMGRNLGCVVNYEVLQP
jgi:hypothetical protein